MSDYIDLKELKEKDLFEPLKNWLEAQGFTVYAEYNGIDVIAVKEDEVVAIEMKKTMNLKVIDQILNVRDRVNKAYVCVFNQPKKRAFQDNNMSIGEQILRKLNVGLIKITALNSYYHADEGITFNIENVWYKPVKQEIPSEYFKNIPDYYKKNIGGVKSGDGSLTPYKVSILTLEDYFIERKNKPSTIKEIATDIGDKLHWTNPKASIRQSLTSWEEKHFYYGYTKGYDKMIIQLQDYYYKQLLERRNE